MANVSLGEGSSPLTAIVLTLSASAGPVLELRLPHNHPWKQEDARRFSTLLGERAELSWAGQTISLRFTGFRAAAGGRDALMGIALSDELLGWFERRRSDDAAVQWLVYQRQQADANGWAFIRRVLGDRFARPHGADSLDPCFPLGSCVLRRAGHDNLAHLERVLSLLAAGATRAYGWCAFDADEGDEPLRLLGLDAPDLALDDDWAPQAVSELQLPHRLAGTGASGALRRGFGTLSAEHAARLVRELTRAGTADAGRELVATPEQFPCLPGPIVIGAISALCTDLRYHFDLEPTPDRGAELVVEMTLRPRPASPGSSPITSTTRAIFVEWDEASERTRIAVSHGDAPWRLMGDADSPDVETIDADKRLICDSLTPFASRGDFAGFYVSHRSDDPVIVELRDGEVPRMIGERQVFAESLEAPDLVINSETITLSGLGKQAELETADGVAIDGASGTLELFAERHVKIKQKVTVTDEESKLEQNAKITGTLDVGE